MMMKELSLHILDIIQNSISAKATLIRIEVEVQHEKDWMRIAIKDNGCGMHEDVLMHAISPFATSRTTRKVGLGIPMFKAGAEAAGGSFIIQSKPGEGTFIQAEYQISHLDRPPMGNLAETLYVNILCNTDIDFVVDYQVNETFYSFDTQVIKKTLGEEIPLQTPEVSQWIKQDLIVGIDALNGGI